MARAFRNVSVIIGGLVIVVMMALGAAAPLLGTVNPTEPHTSGRNKPPGAPSFIVNAIHMNTARMIP